MEPTNCSHPMPSPAPSSILRLCKRLLLRAIQGFTVLSKSILRSISAGTVVILNTRFPFVRLDAQINNTHRRTNKQYTNHSEWGSEPLDQPQTSRANPVKWHSTHNKSHPCPPRIDQATRKQDDKWVYATHCNTLQHTATHCIMSSGSRCQPSPPLTGVELHPVCGETCGERGLLLRPSARGILFRPRRPRYTILQRTISRLEKKHGGRV